MFQTIITILTATTFVAHGLFGCCWHHDHSHPSMGDEAVSQQSNCGGHGCPSHSHHRNSGPSVDGPQDLDHDSDHPLPAKCEGHCLFARTQDSVDSSADVMLASTTFLTLADEMHASLNVEANGTAAREDEASTSLPHCALSQVWLI